MKGSFPLTLRCVLAFVAMATRLRRALIEEKIPSFKIPTNLIHSVLRDQRFSIRGQKFAVAIITVIHSALRAKQTRKWQSKIRDQKHEVIQH